jgi:nitrite reductase/ring-hydroxylating ferredoxin subunit
MVLNRKILYYRGSKQRYTIFYSKQHVMPKVKTTKTLAILLFFSALTVNCSTQNSRRNPYLQEINFSIELNLSLPKYTPLKIIGNPVYIDATGIGTKGIIVMNSGFDQFVAFEASCANHSPNSCSTLVIEGQNGTCDCDAFSYSLFTGQLLNPANNSERTYDLLAYQTQASGNTVRVFN